jgi:hypothetical protein
LLFDAFGRVAERGGGRGGCEEENATVAIKH